MPYFIRIALVLAKMTQEIESAITPKQLERFVKSCEPIEFTFRVKIGFFKETIRIILRPKGAKQNERPE